MVPPGLPFRNMMARVSPDDLVLYANGAMAGYLRVSKRELIGAPLETLAARSRGEISSCFERPTGGKSANRLVTDADGRVFELKTYSEGGVLDIVLDEVTTAESISCDLAAVSGTAVELLNEEELRTARQPERRWMTVSHARLNGLAHLAERLAPMETRLMVNSFAEEAAEAVLETGCTVHHASGEMVIGLFGAPRYFADHALRALQAACDQIEKCNELRRGFFRQGREMPPMSCGIWTGETFVGTLGSSTSLHYAAIGQPVDLAAELCRLARPGEVLLSESTLRSLLQQLPEGWESIRAESETEPDLSDFQWIGDEIAALPPEYVRGVWLIGPGVQEDTSRMEFYLDYLWALKVPGHEEPVPILRVVRPDHVGGSIALSDDNVVTSQLAQTLGKYKLLSVIGTGGMGKVWKAQDRYGNIVAIKVLHGNETASEAQLKRFRREAEIMARLPHRNICRVFEMSEFEDIHFLVMEFVDGLTLADLLYEQTTAETAGQTVQAPDLRSLIHALRTERSSRTEEPAEESAEQPARPHTTRILPVEQTLSIFQKVCEAVQFAHEHGVLHRDLKPGNILLREDGEPLVADFGLAKFESEHSFSVTGNVVGTLENMSPEQAESSKSVDERADVYSLGTILFQMLTGRRHFEATGNIVADAQALQHHESPKPRTFNPRIDVDLEIIVLKALRNSPVERYRSVAALHADLDRYRRGEAISARPVSALDLVRKLVFRNRAVSAVITASLLIFIAGSAAAFWKISERAAAAEQARRAAEDALATAEVQREAARRSEILAQEQKTEAEQRRREAEQALELVRQAREAEKAAHLAAAGARQESAAEREAREKADAALREAEERARNSEQRVAKLEMESLQNAQQPTESTLPEPPRDPELDAARRAMIAAMQRFHGELSAMELLHLERNPEEVLRRVSDGLRDVSEAILIEPDFAPAWMLKGRYHLSILETDRAQEAFQMAARASEARREAGNPDFLRDDDPNTLAAIAADVSKPSGDRFQKAASAVSATGNPQDETVAGLLRFFADKPIARRASLGPSPTGRLPSTPEVALSLVVNNGGNGRVAVNGNEIRVEDIDQLNDFAPLRALGTSRLAISGASTLDWTGLAALPLESLDLTGCRIETFPVNLRGFLKLRHLSLRDTEVSDVTSMRWMPLLESLDLARTNVTDLAPLAFCRRLRTLDAGRLALTNLRPLTVLPIERLTLSPMLVVDKAGLEALRPHRTIRVLRTPDDPEDQPAAEFWRKLDAGEYATGGAAGTSDDLF